VLKLGRGIKPDVVLVDTARGPAVVKDYAPRSPLVRHTLGPWLAARERRSFAALASMDAVPGLLGAIDDLAFAVEFRTGEPLSRAQARRVGPRAVSRFLAVLEATIAQMHERGVVHFDLRHRDNVLMDRSARPVLLDFGTAVRFRPGSVAYRWIRPSLLVYDQRALAKWQARLGPGAAPSRKTWWRRLRSRLRRRSASPPQR